MAIQEGRYTLVYPDGQYRTVRVKVAKKGGLQGRTILSVKIGKDFEGCGFLDDAGNVTFWRRFKAQNPAERMVRIQVAVHRIAKDPDAAGLAYAMKENCCFRCGRELTVPASIHKGMGPECARKNWTRKDQQAAYQWRAGQPKNYQGASYPQQAAEFQRQHGDVATQQNIEFTAEDQQAMDSMAQVAEQEQELRGFASKPDYAHLQKKFNEENCLICRVPRNRCSC